MKDCGCSLRCLTLGSEVLSNRSAVWDMWFRAWRNSCGTEGLKAGTASGGCSSCPAGPLP